jgi:hypothetical protein
MAAPVMPAYLPADRVHIPLNRFIAPPNIGREIAIRAARLAEWNMKIDPDGHFYMMRYFANKKIADSC